MADTGFDFHGIASQHAEPARQLLDAVLRLDRCIVVAESMPLSAVQFYLPDLRAIRNLLFYGDERGFIAMEPTPTGADVPGAAETSGDDHGTH